MAKNNRKLQKLVSKALGSKKDIRGEKLRESPRAPSLRKKKKKGLGDIIKGIKKKFTKKKKREFKF